MKESAWEVMDDFEEVPQLGESEDEKEKEGRTSVGIMNMEGRWPNPKEGEEWTAVNKKGKLKRWPTDKDKVTRVVSFLGAHGETQNRKTISNVDRYRGEWVQIKSVVDSGAAECVALDGMAPHIPSRPTEASKRGLHFYDASGGEIRNEGEKDVHVVTEEGRNVAMNYQTADVVRPLNAVSKICDRGNYVIFTKDKGFIINEKSGDTTSFPREGGVYVLSTWMRRPNSSGFTRQEQ